jgi:hypothetical protein
MNFPFLRTNVSLHSCWKPASHLSWTEEQGEIVVIDAQEGKVYRFNGVGAAVWNAVVRQIPAGDIAIRIADQFEAPLRHIQNDTLKFIAELKDQDLIEPVEENAGH